MASIIKNQLLKHLSRFTKNLSADKIHLSTFKGEGELTNLELDEIVLTDLLELPSWLRLVHAWCNKVTFRIQWTKLKSVPIYLSLDEVHIEVETCEDLRRMSNSQGLSSFAGPAKYSFIHKVIDGITIAVNTVSVTFKSPAFTASVQMSRIMVESKSPTWARCDLRMTRVKDPDRGQLLIFKELEWQTVRIEASSTVDKDLTPLRLLTNQARCRITIKKRLSDCFVMGSRLVIILDDLLWVLTDSQLKAALRFIDSLGGLIEKATVLERKAKAARKLEVLPEYQAQLSQQARTKNVSNTALSKIFSKYDVIETSYHFLSQKIDLHLCDDEGAGRSVHPELKDGGALQISLFEFQVDYYPYHLAMADRKHWARYKDTSHGQWLQQSLNSFRDQFMDLIDTGRTQHSPLTRTQGNTNGNNGKSAAENQEKNSQNNQNQNSQDPKKLAPQPSGNPVKKYVLDQLAKLMTTCIVLRINDFTFYQVTTSKRKAMPKEFVAGDRERLHLPEDLNIFHAEFTYFYYPGDITFPLPPPKFYVQLNPIQVNFDVTSCLWFNSFALNLYHSLLTSANRTASVSTSNLTYFDVKMEAILARIIFESKQDYPNQKDRPKSLHIQTSRATITNVRSVERSSRADLAQCLNAFQTGQMFFGTEFPNCEGDFNVVTEKFLEHSAGTDGIRTLPTNFSSNSVNEMVRQLNREFLWTEAKDVWCCHLEPVWGDFFGARAVGTNRSVPFLDAFPITLWLHVRTEPNASPSPDSGIPSADIHGLAHIGNLISVQINHYQFLFLLRLSEEVAEMTTYLSVDTNRILKVESESTIVLGAIVPQVEVTFIMPSMNPGKENSGGDLESVVPDSSSILDDLGGSAVLWSNAMNARHDYSTKRMNTSNDVDTPQSEVSSMFSMDRWNEQQQQAATTSSQPVVTFKQQNGTKTEVHSNSKRKDEPDIVSSTPTNKPFMSNNFNMDLSSMKKGFSNLMTSIDSALKSSPDDGISDTISIRSDVSSDSENFVVASLEGQEKVDAMFAVDNGIRAVPVEEASEVIEETPDTQSEKSMDSVCRRKDLVSMATFKLSKVELIQQSRGFSSAIKIQVANVGSDECSSIPWDEFQAKFSSRSRGWVELPVDAEHKSRIKLRLDHSLKNQEDSRRLMQASREGCKSSGGINLSDKSTVMGLFEDKVVVRVSDIPLSLAMSSVTGLTDLFEDEMIPKPLPLEVFLENIFLHLNEDRPPANITSPGPHPIDLSISKLRITRESDGIFRIEPIVTANNPNASELMKLHDLERHMEVNALRLSSMQMKSDNDDLKRRLASLEKLSEENLILRRVRDESELLRSYLNSAQEEITTLINEKKNLQEKIKMLQNQSSEDATSNSGRSSWSKR